MLVGEQDAALGVTFLGCLMGGAVGIQPLGLAVPRAWGR